jgi:hypothetical protein
MRKITLMSFAFRALLIMTAPASASGPGALAHDETWSRAETRTGASVALVIVLSVLTAAGVAKSGHGVWAAGGEWYGDRQ